MRVALKVSSSQNFFPCTFLCVLGENMRKKGSDGLIRDEILKLWIILV